MEPERLHELRGRPVELFRERRDLVCEVCGGHGVPMFSVVVALIAICASVNCFFLVKRY